MLCLVEEEDKRSFSKTREILGDSQMGLKLVMSVLLSDICRGLINAVFQISGQTEVWVIAENKINYAQTSRDIICLDEGEVIGEN